MTVHNQKIAEYGKEYAMINWTTFSPGAIQLPVDQTRLPCSKPAKMAISQRANSGDDYKV